MFSRNPVKEILKERFSAKSYYDFAFNMLVNAHTVHEHLHDKVFLYQSIILLRYEINNHLILPMGIHLDYPSTHIYKIKNAYMREKVLCFLWYLCSVYTYRYNLWYPIAIPVHQRPRRTKILLLNILSMVCTIIHLEGKLKKSAKTTGLPFKKLKRSRKS